MGIGEYARELIRAGYGNIEAARMVRQRVPGAKTKNVNIAFYRSQMRKAGEDVPGSGSWGMWRNEAAN